MTATKLSAALDELAAARPALHACACGDDAGPRPARCVECGAPLCRACAELLPGVPMLHPTCDACAIAELFARPPTPEEAEWAIHAVLLAEVAAGQAAVMRALGLEEAAA